MPCDVVGWSVGGVEPVEQLMLIGVGLADVEFAVRVGGCTLPPS